MNRRSSYVTRISGIEVADERFMNIHGPPLTRLPNWGLGIETEEIEYHLHPAITYEIHYQVDVYVFIHAFNGAQGRSGFGHAPLMPWRVSARDSCLVPPGFPIRIVQSTPLEFLGIGISPARFDRLLDKLGSTWPGLDDIFKTTDPAIAVLSNEMRRSMIAEPVGSGDYLDALTDALMTRLITWHLASSSEQPDGPERLSPALARRLAETVEAQLDGPIRVSVLSAGAGLSRSHFSRAFVNTFGMTPQKYIISRRVARARSLLVDTDWSATEIAMRCGFANPSHLTTTFKRELGLTPTAYRRAFNQTRA